MEALFQLASGRSAERAEPISRQHISVDRLGADIDNVARSMSDGVPRMSGKPPFARHGILSAENSTHHRAMSCLLDAMKDRSTGDAVPTSDRPPDGGSRRRLKRPKWQGDHSLDLLILAAWVVFLLVIVLPWMIRQSH